MHALNYPEEILARIRARRESLHIYDKLNAETTALLVVDMQNAYLDGPGAIPAARDIVPNINRLGHEVRKARGQVVWVQNTLDGPSVPPWPPYAKLRSPEFTGRMKEALRDGAAGHALWPGLEISSIDIVHKKFRYSAFAGDPSDIEPVLRKRKIDTVLVCGTVTNVCCESTARDAMMKNFNVVMVADANAARTDEEHVMSLLNVWQFFGDVLTTDEVIGRLG